MLVPKTGRRRCKAASRCTSRSRSTRWSWRRPSKPSPGAVSTTDLTPLSKELDGHRQQRDDDDADRDEREVLLDDGDVAEEQAGADTENHPRGGADEVVEAEGRRPHLRRAGHERDERADDRHEPPEDHRFSAVLFEERVRAREMLLVQELLHRASAIVRAEDFRADDAADGVV